MKRIILQMGVGILNAVYLPFRLCTIKNKITYISRQSDNMSLDYRLLVSKMQQAYPELRNVVLTRKMGGGNRSVLTYPFHMIRQMYHLATSKLVIVDGYNIVVCVLPHKRETKVIQMWHAAAAIKQFGYQTLDKYSGSDSRIAEILKMHCHYDYVLAPSKTTGEHYQKAFQVSESKLVYVGMPHFSELNKFENNVAMEEAYPVLKQKKNILYIPTFRKGQPAKLESLIEGIDFEEYNLIAHLHPLDMAEQEDARVIFDKQFAVYDWIKKADIVIADYSSLIIEAAVLKKRLYFYLYDLEQYAKDPGLNLDFSAEGLSKFVFQDACELEELLEQNYDYQLLEQFAQKYVEIDVDNSVQELMNMLIQQCDLSN